MFKVNNKDIRTTPSIVNFERVIASWVDWSARYVIYHMLQIMKLSSNRELLGYLHSSSSAEAFFIGPGFTSMSLCCHKNKSKTDRKRTREYFVFLKNREVINLLL